MNLREEIRNEVSKTTISENDAKMHDHLPLVPEIPSPCSDDGKRAGRIDRGVLGDIYGH